MLAVVVTSDGLLIVLYGTSPLHLHHAPLDATVADVAEVLRVLLHTLCHNISGGGSEAALALLKVLVVSHLKCTNTVSEAAGRMDPFCTSQPNWHRCQPPL